MLNIMALFAGTGLSGRVASVAFGTSSSNPASVTMPDGLEAGDGVIIFIGEYGHANASKSIPSPTVVDSNGKSYTLIDNTFATLSSNNWWGSIIFGRVWDGSEGSLSITDEGVTDSRQYAWVVLRITGGVTVDAETLDDSDSGTEFTFPSITTTVDGDLILLLGAEYLGGGGNLETATVDGFAFAGGAHLLNIGVGVWYGTQESAGATGTNTSSAVAASSTAHNTYTMAIEPA